MTLGVSVGGINVFPDDYNPKGYNKPWSNVQRNMVKNFFEKKDLWYSTWDEDKSALKIDFVEVFSL